MGKNNIVDEKMLQDFISAAPPITEKVVPVLPTEPAQPENKIPDKRKRSVADFSVFLKPGNLKQRKSVYISQDHQELIHKIVTILGNNLSIGTYVDNVLTEHFQTYSDEINTLYAQCQPQKLINK